MTKIVLHAHVVYTMMQVKVSPTEWFKGTSLLKRLPLPLGQLSTLT